jgi:hypothetical protein
MDSFDAASSPVRRSAWWSAVSGGAQADHKIYVVRALSMVLRSHGRVPKAYGALEIENEHGLSPKPVMRRPGAARNHLLQICTKLPACQLLLLLATSVCDNRSSYNWSPHLVYFEHLRRRISFPLMQAYCNKYKLPTAQGWDKLRDKLDEESERSVERAKEIANVLEVIFRETIPVGDRAIRVFKAERDVIAELIAYFIDVEPESSEYQTTYPAPLSGEKLREVAGQPQLCAIIKSEDLSSLNLVLCTRRVVEERDPRTKEQMGDELLNKYGWGSFDEFIFVKKRYVQSYEIVHLNSRSELIEIRVEDHSGNDASYALGRVQEKFNELLAGKFGMNHQLIKCVNLFPAIKNVYDDATEGMVVELGFTTDTGSAKNEKMRQADLRKELFHMGGKAAVKDIITPFRLAVRWPKAETRLQEEVLLPGSIRQLGGDPPFLDFLVLSGAANETNLGEMVHRIVRRL